LVHAENELHTFFAPAVEVLGEREVGIASYDDLFKASGSTLLDRQVDKKRRILVARTIAATVDDVSGSPVLANVTTNG